MGEGGAPLAKLHLGCYDAQRQQQWLTCKKEKQKKISTTVSRKHSDGHFRKKQRFSKKKVGSEHPVLILRIPSHHIPNRLRQQKHPEEKQEQTLSNDV